MAESETMFYVIIITDAQAIFAYDSKRGAMEKLFSEIAYALNQNIACTCLVIDRHGGVHKRESVEPEVEYNPEAE